MSKKDVIDYVMHTPGNSNPAVLKSLLETVENKPATKLSTSIKVSYAEGTPSFISFCVEKDGDGSTIAIQTVLLSQNVTTKVDRYAKSNIEGYEDEEINLMFLNYLVDTYKLQVTSATTIETAVLQGENCLKVTVPVSTDSIELAVSYVDNE